MTTRRFTDLIGRCSRTSTSVEKKNLEHYSGNEFLSIIAEAESQSSKRRNNNAHRNSIAESWQLDWEAPRAEGLKTTNL